MVSVPSSFPSAYYTQDTHTFEPELLYSTPMPSHPASTSTAFYLHMNTLLPADQPPTSVPPSRFDANGRQMGFVESEVQRRQRVEFLRNRESARRVRKWVEELTEDDVEYERPRMSNAKIPHRNDTTLDPDLLYTIYETGRTTTTSSPRSTPSPPHYPYPLTNPRIHDGTEDFDSEPYIIYMSSPKLPFSNAYLPPSPPPRTRRGSGSSSLHSRHSSLESISEETEE